MKATITYALLAATLFTSSMSATAQEKKKIESLAIGSELPGANVAMKSTKGDEITLSRAKTRNGLIVMFSCNTCPYVVKSEQRTKDVMRFAKEKGVGMVIINSNAAYREKDDSYEAMEAYAKKQGYSVPYVVDEENKVADMFGATRTPEVFLFDKNGKLVYKGAMEDNPSSPSESKEMYLQDAITKMIAGKPVDPNSTKSVGCSIKRNM